MAKTNSTVEQYERIMKDLRSKTYKSIYVLLGNEPYFIDEISNYIAQNVLAKEEQEFNLMMLYGENTTAKQIDVAARRYPMMCERQVLIVKEAQQIKKIEELAGYVSNPLKTTMLVICLKGKALDKRTSFYKSLVKAGEVFDSESFKSYDTAIVDWIVNYLKNKNCKIDNKAATLLVEALGTELSKIVSELDRLIMSLPVGTSQITVEHVETLGVSKDFNSFELCSALMQKNALKVHQIINYFDKNPKNFDLPSTLGAIFSQFTKLFSYQMLRAKYKSTAIPAADLQEVIGVHPFIITKDYVPAAAKFTTSKVANIITEIRRCDMRSKGWGAANANSGDLLKELAYVIMY
jgi:DNA polymerase-3 subunit delta